MPVREDEATELQPGTEAHRVDAVGSPANGTEWLFLKSMSDENGTRPLTEVEAAMLASKRAGERLDRIMAKSNSTGRTPHDSPTYGAYDAVGTAENAQPNSTVNGEGSPSGSGTGEPEVDALLMKAQAQEFVGHCDYLLSLALMKAEAEYDTWVKGKYTAEQRRDLLSAGKAMRNANGDPSYPIDDTDDLGKAIKAVGRGGASHNAVRRFIMKRARAMGKSSMIPENWQADGSLAKDAAYLSQPGATLNGQMQPEDGTADLDPDATGDQAVADGGTGAATDGSTPGSPAWEQADADRLIAAGQLIAQVCQKLCDARDSEAAEVAAGHFDDQANVCDLQDAKCAAEYALGIVARLAFHEEVEANTSMVKQERLTGAAVDVIRQTISLLKSGELDWLTEKQPAPDGSGTDEEVWSMDLTKEDLAAVVGEVVDAKLSDFAKAQKGKADKKAAKKLAKEQAAAAAAADPAPAPAADPDPNLVKDGDPAPAPAPAAAPAAADPAPAPAAADAEPPEWAKSISERLANLEAQPQPGGPLVGAAAGGMAFGAPRGGGSDDGAPPRIATLRNQLAKAEADGNVGEATRLRKELGNDVLAFAWAARGYPATDTARGQAMQFTGNAAGA